MTATQHLLQHVLQCPSHDPRQLCKCTFLSEGQSPQQGLQALQTDLYRTRHVLCVHTLFTKCSANRALHLVHHSFYTDLIGVLEAQNAASIELHQGGCCCSADHILVGYACVACFGQPNTLQPARQPSTNCNIFELCHEHAGVP